MSFFHTIGPIEKMLIKRCEALTEDATEYVYCFFEQLKLFLAGHTSLEKNSGFFASFCTFFCCCRTYTHDNRSQLFPQNALLDSLQDSAS